MNYEVQWDPQCFAQLDEIAAAGVTFDRLKSAVSQIDTELSDEPTMKGLFLSEGLYMLDVPPLRAYFHVERDTQVAIVDGVRRMSR